MSIGGSTDSLKYTTNASGSWVTSTIDSTGDVGQYTSITVDSNIKVHISYFDYTNYDLKYATNASGSWVTYTIDSTGNVGYYTSIAIDSNNKVHISYYYRTESALKYATNVPVTGPGIFVSPASNNFGTLIAGTFSDKTITVQNAGTAELIIGSIAQADLVAAPFSIVTDNCSGQTLMPSGSCTLTVRFSPDSFGNFIDTFDIPSNDTVNNPATVSISGTGIIAYPDMTVLTAPVNFGNVVAGTSSDQTVTVRNDGTGDLIIGNIAQVDPVGAPFSIITDNCSGQTLAPSTSCTVIMRFAPAIESNFSDTLDIPSNDPIKNPMIIILNGSGVIVDEGFETGNLNKIPWGTGGNGVWTLQSNVKHNGNYAAKAPLLLNGQSSFLEVSLNIKSPGNIVFWYKVSSYIYCYPLIFKIDGTQQGSWGGEMDWTNAGFAVSAGQHTFRWEFSKSGCGPSGGDTAWIDDIAFPPMDWDGDGYDSSVDCNDYNPLEHPNQTWYLDSDDDGYSEGTTNTTSCTRPVSYKAASELIDISLDCDDTNLVLNPATSWHPDFDLDGYGNPSVSLQQCTQPEGYILNNTDCNDNDANIYPGGLPARIPGTSPVYFTTLQAAYDAAGDGDTIQVQAAAFTESFNLNLNKSVTLNGGYDCGYAA
ncbi:MAG: choice-of-anchor D domain-containing protein, partial [Nitrospirae bacterium]|nr:choice-of-anchor D domain-containing protein [Nitrospirota bacterium]